MSSREDEVARSAHTNRRRFLAATSAVAGGAVMPHILGMRPAPAATASKCPATCRTRTRGSRASRAG